MPLPTPDQGKVQPVSFQTRVEWRKAQPGDSYESLSQQFYGTPALAPALREYNRTKGVGPMQGQQLTPGDSVILPDPSALGQPQPGGGPMTAPATGAGVSYRVGATGETLYAIAQKTLQADRWQEIARLNRSLSSEQAVPPGTVVQLPADAIVPVENRP